MDFLVILERITDRSNESMTIDKLRRYKTAFEGTNAFLLVGGKVHNARWGGFGPIFKPWMLPVGNGTMAFANHLFYLTSSLFVGARAIKRQRTIQYVTNTYGHYTLGVIVIALAKITHRKAIVRVAGLVSEVLARNRFQDRLLYPMLLRLERFAFDYADALVKASSSPLERKYERKTFEIPYVVERPRKFGAVKSRAANVVLFVGRLEPEKGATTLIEAVKMLVERHCDLKVTIVGAGSLRGVLLQELERSGLSHCVTMKGFVMHTRVLRMMRSATLLVVPSVIDYAPEVVVEAAVNDLPVIATSTGALPYMIRNGHTGILVSPKDPYALSVAIEGLLRDSQLRRRIASAAHKSVLTRYSSEQARLTVRRLMKYVFGKSMCDDSFG